MLPNSYEKYFYLQHKNPITHEITDLKKSNYKYLFNGGSEYVEIIGLADLGIKQPIYNQKYIEDHDNQIDIILKGNESVVKNIISLIVPSDGNEYTKFYNPGGPGPTPIEGITYTMPSAYQKIDIINNLENPKCVYWINIQQKL